jgi:uncharacterized phage-like protein YoqJ
MDIITMAVTGHRSHKLGGYDKNAQEKVSSFARIMISTYKTQVHSILSRKLNINVGMALGWDMAVAGACLELDIPYTVYIPFEGQERRWDIKYQNEYRSLLRESNLIINTDPGKFSIARKMQIRNQRMVDDSSMVLALWDGTPSGTKNCIDYAASIERNVFNSWDRWVEFNRIYEEIPKFS